MKSTWLSNLLTQLATKVKGIGSTITNKRKTTQNMGSYPQAVFGYFFKRNQNLTDSQGYSVSEMLLSTMYSWWHYLLLCRWHNHSASSHGCACCVCW